ncbi:MAG: CopG family antitoxin [Candidatus Hydrogenedentota bacterium]
MAKKERRLYEKNKRIVPIPEHFTNIKESSEFWDTYDAGDHEKYLRPIQEDIKVSKKLPQAVLVKPSLLEKLKKIAKQKGISLETLINLWLNEKVLSGI